MNLENQNNRQKLTGLICLVVIPVVYAAIFWAAGRAYYSSECLVLGLLPLTLFLSYRLNVLHFQMAKRLGIKDALILLLVLLISSVFSCQYNSQTKLAGTLSIFAVVIAAPINEELIFRASAIGKGADAMGRLAALVISSALFSFSHSQPFPAFVIGVILGLTYLKYNSVLITIAFHAILNLLPFLF